MTNLATARHLNTINRSRDLDGAHGAVLAALLTDVLQDLLIVVIVQQLFRHDHVQQTQHLCRQTQVVNHLQAWDLKRDGGLYNSGLHGEEALRLIS